jgi:hypothetical protein
MVRSLEQARHFIAALKKSPIVGCTAKRNLGICGTCIDAVRLVFGTARIIQAKCLYVSSGIWVVNVPRYGLSFRLGRRQKGRQAHQTA